MSGLNKNKEFKTIVLDSKFSVVKSFYPQAPVADRIQELDARYNNLRFAACGNTLERLRRERGETIVVLPEATVVNSGVSFVTRRQQEGWVYIKV